MEGKQKCLPIIVTQSTGKKRGDGKDKDGGRRDHPHIGKLGNIPEKDLEG